MYILNCKDGDKLLLWPKDNCIRVSLIYQSFFLNTSYKFCDRFNFTCMHSNVKEGNLIVFCILVVLG